MNYHQAKVLGSDGVAGILLGAPLIAAVKVPYRHFVWRDEIEGNM